MPDPEHTLVSLGRDMKRLETQIAQKVSKREMDDVKADVNKVERKLDEIIQTQLANQRTAIWQLVGIMVTLIFAGYTAVT